MTITGLHDELGAMLGYIESLQEIGTRNVPEVLVTLLTTFDRGGHYWQAMSGEVRLALIDWMAGCLSCNDADAFVGQLMKHDYDLAGFPERLRQSGRVA